MTASVLQEKMADASASATTITLSPTSAFTAGSALHIACTFGSETATATCSDGTNTYSAAQDYARDTPNHQSVAHFYANNIASGSPTITITFSTSVNFRGIYLAEIGGVTTTAADGHNGQNQATPGTGTDAVSSGTVTNSNQPALLNGVCCETAGIGAPSRGTGFSAGIAGWGFGGTNLGISENKRYTDTTGHAATFTAGSNVNHGTVAMMFDESGGGGGSTFKSRRTLHNTGTRMGSRGL